MSPTAPLLHEPRYTCITPVLFYLQAIMDYQKKGVGGRAGGRVGEVWVERRGERSQSSQRRAISEGGAVLFQSVRYFSPHQLVLRRWQLVQFGASRWPIVRAFFPCSPSTRARAMSTDDDRLGRVCGRCFHRALQRVHVYVGAYPQIATF